MKKHLVDMTLAIDNRTGIAADITSLETAVDLFAYLLDDDQRKRLQCMGLRNETFGFSRNRMGGE